MAELMKESMRATFAQPDVRTFSSYLAKVPKIPSKIRRSASSVRTSIDRSRTQIALDELAQIGASSGTAPFAKPCLVGTFHKTGTTLVWKILQDLAHFGQFDLWNIGMYPDEADKPWLVGFDWWSDFDHNGLDVAQFPTVAMIRDPRNVLVSSMKFHKVSAEPWLHVPRGELGGQTYQQALCALETDEERFHFELKHQGGSTIADMLAAKRNPAHAETLFLPLEDLMGDYTLSAYKRMWEHLGLSDAYLPLAMAVAFQHSVFRPGFRKSKHITSGRPKVWQQTLPQSVLDALDEAYPNAAEELGYE